MVVAEVIFLKRNLTYQQLCDVLPFYIAFKFRCILHTINFRYILTHVFKNTVVPVRKSFLTLLFKEMEFYILSSHV